MQDHRAAEQLAQRVERPSLWPWTARSRWFVLAVAAPLASRAGYALLGVRYDAQPLSSYWQYLDPELLRHALLQSLYYLHSQPPLFNLFLGLVLKLFPGHTGPAFQVAFLVCGLAIASAMFWLMLRLGARPALCAVVAMLFAVGPNCVLYENWLFYTYPEMALLLLAALALSIYLQSRSIPAGALCFLCCAALCLLHSLFHPAWMGLAVAVVLLARGVPRRRTVLLAVLPLLLVAALYAKNGLLFGRFAGGSWLGMNLSRITTMMLSPARRAELVAQGRLSPLALIPPFSPLVDYAPYVPPAPETGIPVLDQQVRSTGAPNYNNLLYLRISDLYLQDALAVVRGQPQAYLMGLVRSWYYYLLPPSDYFAFDSNDNRARLGAILSVYNTVVYGQLYPRVGHLAEGQSLARMARSICLNLVLAQGAILAYGVVRGLRALRAGVGLTARQAVLLFMGMSLAYMAVAGNLLELSENNRFRYTVEPLLFVLVGVLVDRAITALSARVVARREEQRVARGRGQLPASSEGGTSSNASVAAAWYSGGTSTSTRPRRSTVSPSTRPME